MNQSLIGPGSSMPAGFTEPLAATRLLVFGTAAVENVSLPSNLKC